MQKKFFFLLLSCIVIAGCATFSGDEYKPDSNPPPGYSPVFLTSIKPFSITPQRPAVEIRRIELTDPSKIRLYVQISDSAGAYLRGATEGKFKNIWCELREEIEGETNNIKNYTLREVTEIDKIPYAVAIVMDHSGSMGDERARIVQNAVAKFLRDDKKAEDEIALVKYDHRTVTESPLASNSSELASRLRIDGLMSLGGGTAIANGISAGISELAAVGDDRKKAVIIFTDGYDNSSTVSKDSVIVAARKRGITINTVDFGEYVNTGYMKEYADKTGGSYHHIYSSREFDMVFEDVYRRLKNSYIIEYTPRDYGVHTVNLKLCLGRDTALARAQYDNMPDIGSIALLNVLFDYNKATLTPDSKRAIDNVYMMMKAFPKMKIELRGHTDSQNSTSDMNYNKKLSEKRAEAVRDALVKKGIDAGRISTIGFGETQPVADNSTEEGRARNRRTEFIITER